MASLAIDQTAPALDTVEQPCVSSPYSLHTWWDMEKFSAARFYDIACQLSILGENAAWDDLSGIKFSMTPEQRSIFLRSLRSIEADCASLGLKVSLQAASAAILSLDRAKYFGDVAGEVGQFRNVIEWEMSAGLFFHMPSKQAAFYSQPEMFGAEVCARFPSIHFDMVEAGNCFAMGRGTACVFHLMRVVETGVQEFGRKLGITLVEQKNWQNILDEVTKAIKALPTKAPGTVELSQVAANLYAVKLAWRNEVMHPNDKYTLEEAENLLGQVKLFMGQLAVVL
jgi:hypothetical protein